MREYMNKRYGDDSLVSFGAAQNIRTEEQALSDIETGKAQVLEGEDIVMPNVPSMGNEPIVHRCSINIWSRYVYTFKSRPKSSSCFW